MKLNLRHAFSVFLFAFPIIANAEISIINNTDEYFTAYVKSSPCSSRAGSRGIVSPHSKLGVPFAVIAYYCGFSDCNAHIFMNSNCNEPEVGTATVSYEDGVSAINNEDQTHYKVTFTPYEIIVDPVSEKRKGFFDFLFKLFKS